MSRITIITDAAPPQINGVVTTLLRTKVGLEHMGHHVDLVTPDPNRRQWSLPSYREIKVQLFAKAYVQDRLLAFKPDYIHIATEGPLGLAARKLCLADSRPFTTAFHTEYADYIHVRVKTALSRTLLPSSLQSSLTRVAHALTWQYLKWFHAPSSAIMVASQAVRYKLKHKGFRRLASWSRGVDTDQFKPYGKTFAPYTDLPRPILLYMGRVAPEKDIDHFLALETPGSKVVVGDGPYRASLQRRFPHVFYAGSQTGETLGRYVAAADLFVFPSRSDTFGLVVLEALACGVPVVAVPHGGPKDILGPEICRTFSCLNDDFGAGVRSMIERLARADIDADAARTYVSLNYSWAASCAQFYKNLQADTPKARRKTKRLGRAVFTLLRPSKLLTL